MEIRLMLFKVIYASIQIGILLSHGYAKRRQRLIFLLGL